MKQVMNCHKDNGLLNMIRRTDPMISFEFIVNGLVLWVYWESKRKSKRIL